MKISNGPGISNGLENTNDKSSTSRNSDKLFIRTMEDDLKKIKSSPAGNDGAASVISSLASASSRASAPYKEIKRPISAPASASNSASLVPKNLPLDMSVIEKEKPKAEAKAEILKPVEKLKDTVDSSMSDNRVLGRFKSSAKEAVDEKKKEKIFSAFKPIAPASADIFSARPQSAGKLVEETENLSPEARLARQLSLGASDSAIESKESLAAPLPAKISSAASEQSGKLAGPFNPALPVSPSFASKRKSIEEIIKEDSSDSLFGKFVKMLFAILIIAGIVAGAYYLYIARKPADKSISTEAFVVGVMDATIKADLNADLNREIKLFFSDIRPSGIYRLMLKDKDGQRGLDLENFKKSLNIILPDSIADVLEKDYNLMVFNYPEKNYLRLGLVLKPKNSVDVSAFAGSWEPDMYGSVEAMFLGDSGIYDSRKQFRSNNHNNFDIRYLPLGFENIALNYAIDNEKKFLLIATSKEDIFNLIDKIIKGE